MFKCNSDIKNWEQQEYKTKNISVDINIIGLKNNRFQQINSRNHHQERWNT